MCSKFCFNVLDSFFLFHKDDGKVLTKSLTVEVKGTRLGQIKPCIIIPGVSFCTLIINEYSDL